ncbi:sodium channel subunit beta-4-like [Anabas testudineus]|uniref:sodium channel subunit beta-4-like n=1 Tax=Anabas testudineus TaxID=64144 RepID=UPI00143DE69E|nr:sodium channel subunit beta-4-like [Anabas testudineus]
MGEWGVKWFIYRHEVVAGGRSSDSEDQKKKEKRCWEGTSIFLQTQQETVVELSVVKSKVTGSHEPVRAVVAEDVILPCHLEPPFDVTTLRVDWIFNEELTVHVYRSQRDDPDSQHKKFKHRTSLFHDELHKGNISLKLTNVSETDAGNYTCYVPRLKSRGSAILIVDPVKKKNKIIEQPDPTVSSSTDSTRLSSGLVAGIVILCLIGLVCLAAGFILCKRQSMCPAQNTRQSDRQNPEKGQDRLDGSPLQHRVQRRQRGQHRQHQQH